MQRTMGSAKAVWALLATILVAGALALATPATAATPKCGGKKATIVGTNQGETLKGTKKNDVIVARGGNDIIKGLGGNDIICGGAGKDTIDGGAGADTLFGDAGSDKLVGGKGNDKLNGGKGNDTCKGGPGKDKLTKCGAPAPPPAAVAQTPTEVKNGRPVLDAGPLKQQVNWWLDEWDEPTTTIADIEAHIHPSYFEFFTALQLADFINEARNNFTGEIEEVLFLWPNHFRATMRRTDGDLFVFNVITSLDGSGLITQLGLMPFQEAAQVLPVHSGLTTKQAVDALADLHTDTSVLVAKIENNKCVAEHAHRANVTQPTASIFKVWVLGALAKAVNAGDINPTQKVILDPDDTNPNGAIINEAPPGTKFTVKELATYMLAVSDNTATDHMIELVGRDKVDAAVSEMGHSNSDAMTPVLKTNQMFNFRTKVPASDVDAYLSSTEAEQLAYVDDVLAPFGAFGPPYPHLNDDALTTVSWLASPFDVCRAMASLRQVPESSKGGEIIRAAYGGFPLVSDLNLAWDRVWYKGGSLGVNNDGLIVLTLGVMVESKKGTYAAIVMVETPANQVVDEVATTSLLSRILLNLG